MRSTTVTTARWSVALTGDAAYLLDHGPIGTVRKDPRPSRDGRWLGVTVDGETVRGHSRRNTINKLVLAVRKKGPGQ